MYSCTSTYTYTIYIYIYIYMYLYEYDVCHLASLQEANYNSLESQVQDDRFGTDHLRVPR